METRIHITYELVCPHAFLVFCSFFQKAPRVEFPIPVWLGTRSSSMQLTPFARRCSTSGRGMDSTCNVVSSLTSTGIGCTFRALKDAQ